MNIAISNERPPVHAGAHRAVPLAFDPGELNGFSEALIRAHWEKNYVGSIDALNATEARLAAAMRDPDFPPLVYGGLKREEAHRAGSIGFHERYFANLGGDGKPGGAIVPALDHAYGGPGAWRAEFVRTALSLAGGSGWCVLGFDPRDGALRNHWAWDHMHGAVACIPLLVLDMYEHAYQIDFGPRAADYVETFLRNVRWDEVDRRYAEARVAHAG